MPQIIQLQNATIGYPDKVVLDHLDWEIQRGEHWAITGPNGCGKTTLMRTLLRLIPLRSGELRCYDAEGKLTDGLVTSYLPQISQIDRHFPIHVYEVIDSGLPDALKPATKRWEKIQHLAEATGISLLLGQPIGRLSGGQLQRTLLARALASDPELLILDEPLSFLDRSYKESFEELLSTIVRPETTILMVTHDLQAGDQEHWQVLSLGHF